MIEFLMLAVVLLVVMIAAYFIIDHFFPTFGTVAVNLLVGFLALADQILAGIQALPWAQILEPKQVGAVMFAIAFANFIMRLRGPKKAVGAG